MKLLLTSSGLDSQSVVRAFVTALPETPQACSVILFALIGDEVKQASVDEAVQELREIGVNDIIIFNLANEHFVSTARYDVTYVYGGNTFAILERMRATGADVFVGEAVRAGSLYVGVSAGSIMAGPNIELAGWGSSGDPNNIHLKDLTSFGFTDLLIWPHYRPELHEEIEAFPRRSQVKIIEIADGEAVFVEGSRHQLIR